MKFYKIVILILLSVFFIGVYTQCAKPVKVNSNVGMVLYTNSFINDGCDWVVVINNEYFHPESQLDSLFKKDSIKVSLNYELKNKYFHCGNTKNRIRIINVESISKI